MGEKSFKLTEKHENGACIFISCYHSIRNVPRNIHAGKDINHEALGLAHEEEEKYMKTWKKQNKKSC